MTIDPEDPRPPYLQVAGQLRAAILTKKYVPGDQLPSGPELAKQYGVARQTAQNAIKVLRDEGLVVSRHGSGTYVRDRTGKPVDVRSHIERAFTAKAVTIDFAGFSGETLHGALSEPLDKVRHGRLTPESVTIRILLPDTTIPMGLPCRADDLSDDPAIRARSARIMSRHTEAIMDSIEELGGLGLVRSASASIRVYGGSPLFKLYIINGEDAFFGYYPVIQHTVTIDGAEVPMFDPMGKDATLFHHAVDDDADSIGSQYVAQSQMWFESMWNTVAREPHR
jgi:DNA-binding transcriptional regulator YhcF (GntR family)